MSQDLELSPIPAARLPLKAYLENIWLPSFKRPGARPLGVIARARAWPRYPELQRDPGTRRLGQILRIDQWNFVLIAEEYMKQLSNTFIENEALVEEEDSPRLRLPSKNLVTYEDSDIEFLSQINNEDDLLALVQDYILGTISEAIRLVEHIPLDDPTNGALKFRHSSYLCPAHHARWDIFTLPGDELHPVPVAVIFVPPWELGIQDFADFTAPQRFELGALDTLNTSTNTIADKLWAVVHDTCQGRGKYFVVTNYTRWAFGELSPDDTVARITDSFEAPILDLDGTHEAVPWVGFNVVEFLTFWVHSALHRSSKD